MATFFETRRALFGGILGYQGFGDFRGAIERTQIEPDDSNENTRLLTYVERETIRTLTESVPGSHRNEFKEYAYFLLYHFRSSPEKILVPLSVYLIDHPAIPSYEYFVVLREVTLAAAVVGFPSIERLVDQPTVSSSDMKASLSDPLDPRNLLIMFGYLSDLILQLVALHKWRLEPVDPNRETPEQAYIRMNPLPKGVPFYGVMFKIKKGGLSFTLPATLSSCVRPANSGKIPSNP